MFFYDLFYFYFVPAVVSVFSSCFLMEKSFIGVFREKINLILFFLISFFGVFFSNFFFIFSSSSVIRFLFITFFFINFFIDLYEKSIYNLISILFFITAISGFFLNSIVHINLNESIFCGILFRAAFYLIFFIFKYYKKYEGIGEGDIDIISGFAYFGGFLWTILSIFLSCIFGIIFYIIFYFIYKKISVNYQIPFAPIFFCGVATSYFLIFFFSLFNHYIA